MDYKTECPYYENNCDLTTCACPKYKAWEYTKNASNVKQTIEQLGVDFHQENWKIIMEMQKKFSVKFRPVENQTKDEKDEWINKYLICIEDEIGELRDMLNIDGLIWEKPFEVEEAKKEVIDILHFVMDTIISYGVSVNEIKQWYFRRYCDNIIDVKDFLNFTHDITVKKPLTQSDVFIKINNMSKACREVRQHISWKHWKRKNEKIDHEKMMNALVFLMKCYFDLAYQFMNDKEMVDIYIKKNVENIARANFGY